MQDDVNPGNQQLSATDVFHNWAISGKDEGMESGHGPAVQEMLLVGLAEISKRGSPFSAVDVGCGNGWATRQLASMPFCKSAIGIDGAQGMIEKAKQLDQNGTYIHTEIMHWDPPQPVELIHSMEVFYYLKDTQGLLNHLYKWLSNDGILIFGVDRYEENVTTHSWDTDVGCFMALHSEKEWMDFVENAGFEIVKKWRAATSSDWPGTLAIMAKKPSED
ncbi:MAG: class I SAM-dependent methyltransferase [Euryarchaeota archaeon]|jgi:predicted TPR repeat methyltransferase|nr:class I SAM-dependent methyltransferase [Euryarchaeota archaeon]MBT3971908.1 class I SAM-dependent methyltransferase [Euryarchaeota archaeon]MBT4407837.1 class I SAM-dependent methyltransferase [Euryarchaeota archaeon]MBT6644490.1 class I SAM-dependent methyltransferase [Euryarchaeota archaeon]